MKVGDKVHYIPFDGAASALCENGIIKSFSSDGDPFVVYHCGEDWDNYSQYTAAKSPIKRIILGWE